MTDTLSPLPRCCPKHADWRVLSEHLCADFPQVAQRQVVRDLVEARRITQTFGLDGVDALDIAELIVRYRALMASGEVDDVARLDPQPHLARMSPTTVAAHGCG